MGYLNLLSIPFPMSVGSAIVLTFGVVALFLSFPVQHAEAAAVTWDGGGDGSSWSDPLNWSGDKLPRGTDTIKIDGNDEVDSTVTLDIDFQLDARGSIITTGQTIIFGDRLIIPSGITLTNFGTINHGGIMSNQFGGTINNNGIIKIYYQSSFANRGTLNNNGTLKTNSTFYNNGVVNNSGTINITDGGIVNEPGVVNNSGTIINRGGIILNSDGTIRNSGTINNNAFISNYGPIENFGTIYNSGLDSGVSIFNRDTINNYGTFNNDRSIDNSGAINNKCGATFNNNGTFTGNPVNYDICYNLNLFEGSGDAPDQSFVLGQEARAVANTTDPAVSQVNFTWNNPSGDPVHTQLVPLSLTGQAESRFTPDEVGKWTVYADFGNGEVRRQTFDVRMFLIPESPIGTLALIASSMAALAFYGIRGIHRRKEGK